MEGYIGGIALPTNVTLGSCLPSMLCVEDVYLTTMFACFMAVKLPHFQLYIPFPGFDSTSESFFIGNFSELV